MNGHQPKKKCANCLSFDVCKKKHKNKVCKKYNPTPPPQPPKSGSCVVPPKAYECRPDPMPEIKPTKQRTVLSVRDFAILYNIIDDKIRHMESQAQWVLSYFFHKEPTEEEKASYIEKNMEQLKQDPHYQDLLRIRDKLGELNIEVETPIVEVEE